MLKKIIIPNMSKFIYRTTSNPEPRSLKNFYFILDKLMNTKDYGYIN